MLQLLSIRRIIDWLFSFFGRAKAKTPFLLSINDSIWIYHFVLFIARGLECNCQSPERTEKLQIRSSMLIHKHILLWIINNTVIIRVIISKWRKKCAFGSFAVFGENSHFRSVFFGCLWSQICILSLPKYIIRRKFLRKQSSHRIMLVIVKLITFTLCRERLYICWYADNGNVKVLFFIRLLFSFPFYLSSTIVSLDAYRRFFRYLDNWKFSWGMRW